MQYPFPIAKADQNSLHMSLSSWFATRVASRQRFDAFALFYALLLSFRTSGPVPRCTGLFLVILWCIGCQEYANVVFLPSVLYYTVKQLGFDTWTLTWLDLGLEVFPSPARVLALKADTELLRRSLKSAQQQLADMAGGTLEELDPREIRFTHDSISFCFRSGAQLDTVIKSILDGQVSHEEFPPLEVTQVDGKWYSISNRRLFVLRVLASRGLVKTTAGIVYAEHGARLRKLRDGRTKWQRSFSTTNDGRSVKAGVCGVCGKKHDSEFQLDSLAF